MAAPNPVATDLLTEHLAHTPLSLIDDIINALNALIYQSVAAVETFLLSAAPATLGFDAARQQRIVQQQSQRQQHRGQQAPPPASEIPDTDDAGQMLYPEAEVELSQGIHALETLLEATVDKAFDKFEIYVLRNTFAIDEQLLPYVTLPHYRGLDLSSSSSAAGASTGHPNEKITLETLKEQRAKLVVERKFKNLLEKEKAKNEALLGQLRALTRETPTVAPVATNGDIKMENAGDGGKESVEQHGPLSFLTRTGDGLVLVGNDGLTSSSSFALAQLPYLKAVLERLRPFVEQRAGEEDGNPNERDAMAGSGPSVKLRPEDPEARLRYIENRTRIHIERRQQQQQQEDQGGHGLEEAGLGDWKGSRVASADLQNLEAFLKSLSASGEAEVGPEAETRSPGRNSQ